MPDPGDGFTGGPGDAPLPTERTDDAGQRLPRRAKRHGRHQRCVSSIVEDW